MRASTLRQWMSRHHALPQPTSNKTVFLFVDEFTNYNDGQIGQTVVKLLEALGYQILVPPHLESGRSALSKGFLRRARRIAQENVRRLEPLINADTPMIGIEPSALLTFRDEYPDLLRGEEQAAARRLARHCFLFEEFVAREMDAGRISAQSFSPQNRVIHLHGHCQHKALASLTPTVRMLEALGGYDVRVIPSGCCGMAGSFGYETEHYDLSQKIGELVLFPRIRAAAPGEQIVASGTSCRHQIHDATGITSLHPAELLFAALS